MRIILTQMEIEEAIEKLILDQVDVPDDMRIDIDLKATRGEEGYQAFIDIVDHDAPEDGSDRSVDPRIKPIEGAETLGIAEKVLEAKAEASKPRRRGRPAGARNKPKLSKDHRSTEDKVQVEHAQEPVQEAQESVSEAKMDQDTQEVEQAPTEAPAVPAATEETAEVNEPANEPVIAEAQAEEETKEETKIEVTTPVAAPTMTEQDISAQASDELVESMSEPQPEPEPNQSPEPVPANPQPTRSLFANLSRPTNGG